jgi:hypothetical protein
MVSPIDNDALLPSSSRTTIIPANDFQFFRGSLHLDCLSFRFKISWPVHPGNAWDEDAHRHTIVVGLLPPRCFVSFILLIFVVCAHTLPRRLGSAIVQPPSRSPPTSSSFFDMMDDGVPRACPDRSRPNPHAPHDDVDEDPTTGPTGWGGGGTQSRKRMDSPRLGRCITFAPFGPGRASTFQDGLGNCHRGAARHPRHRARRHGERRMSRTGGGDRGGATAIGL